MAATTKSQITDLALLDLKKKSTTTPVRVIMLPSDASSTIVNYSAASALQVTCVIPAKKREVNVRGSHKKVKLQTPSLLISVRYSDLPTSKSNQIENFFIYGYYTRDKKTVWAAPYVVSNVYSHGAICFGGLRPKDLRSAYNLFWNSPFNYELEGEWEEAFCNQTFDCDEDFYDSLPDVNAQSTGDFIKKYTKKVFDLQDWDDYTEIICGSKYWAAPGKPHAVLITKDKTLLKQIPKEYWCKQGGQALLIAKAKRFKKFWAFDTGSVKFKLPLDQVSTGAPNPKLDEDDDYDDGW